MALSLIFTLLPDYDRTLAKHPSIEANAVARALRRAASIKKKCFLLLPTFLEKKGV
jgi:hypothetical protein